MRLPDRNKYDSVVTRSQAVDVLLIALQLLDPLAVGNWILGKAGAIGKNLFGDSVGKSVQVTLGFLGKKNLVGHALAARFFLCLDVYSDNRVVRPARTSASPSSIFFRRRGL
jgi:hypothetical protein